MSKNTKAASVVKAPLSVEPIQSPEQIRAAEEAAQREAERFAAAEAGRAEADRLAAERAAQVVEQRRAGAEAARVLAEQAAVETSRIPEAQAEVDRVAAEAPPLVRARVLVGCALGHCDDVVEVAAEDLPGLAGVVDADRAAVAYAQSIKKA